jgi:hypothetical protein
MSPLRNRLVLGLPRERYLCINRRSKNQGLRGRGQGGRSSFRFALSMSTAERKGAASSGRHVVVWTTEHRGSRYRYVQTSEGRLISFGRYLGSMLEKEEQREERAQRRNEDAMVNVGPERGELTNN